MYIYLSIYIYIPPYPWDVLSKSSQKTTLTPDILISCQMCRRVGSSFATVYLLGNHVFLDCICSVLPEDSPVQTVDGGVIAALNRISSQWLNSVQTLLLPNPWEEQSFWKFTLTRRSHTSSSIHTCSAPWKEAVIQTDSRIKLWVKKCQNLFKNITAL